MDELEQKVNDYINNNLLNFNNFPETSLNKENFREEVLKRLYLKKYSKKAQYDAAKEYTEGKLDNILKDNLPFIFCFCFGGYKHFWSPTYPEPDWAEIFTIKYLMEYILPIAKSYDNGVNLEFESEEVAISEMNNVPREGLDKYNRIFRELLEYINNKTNEPINLNLVLAKDFYDREELLSKMKDYVKEVEDRFEKLDDEEKAIRLRRAETNIKWDGIKDLTNLSEEERQKAIYDSRILNEAFLDIDYELRGKEYFEKENLIPLLGTFGYGAGGELWLHVASNKTSVVDFWTGIGILEVRENGIFERTLSEKQFNNIKDQLVKVKINSDLEKLSSNYSWIYVYQGTLNF